MIRTRYFFIISILVIVVGCISLFLNFKTETPQEDLTSKDTVIMAEPQDVSVAPNLNDNKYIKRAIFIEKIRNTLRINPIPEPEPTPEPTPTVISAPEPQPDPVPVIIPIPEPVATNTPTSTPELLIGNIDEYVDNQATSTS